MSVQNILAGLGDPYALAKAQDEAYRQIRATKDIQAKSEEERQGRLAAASVRGVYRATAPGEAEMPTGGAIPGLPGIPDSAAAAVAARAPAPAPASPRRVPAAATTLPTPSQATENQSGAETRRLAAVPTDMERWAQGPRGEKPIDQRIAEGRRYQQLKQLNPSVPPAAQSAAETKRLAERGAAAAATAAPTGAAAMLTPEFFAVQRQVESGNRPGAVSPKGAVGTMQTMPSTLTNPGFGVAPARDNSPAELQRVGEDYMRAMVREFGNLPDALVAYNWGPQNAKQWVASGRNPAQLPAETQGYLQKILGAVGQGVNAMVPSAQAAQPAAPAQAPAAPAQTFTPEQFMAVRTQNLDRVRMAQMRLQQVQQLMQATRDTSTLEKLNTEAFAARAAIYEGQLFDAHTRAMQGDETALSQLAQVIGLPIAKVGNGYVAVQVDPATGNGRAISQPMSAGEMSRALYNRASEAGRQAVAAQAAAEAKSRGELAVEQTKGQYALYRSQMEAQADLQKMIAERRLAQNDIKGIEFNPNTGQAYVRTNSGIMEMRPGQMVDGMMTEPTLVPARAGLPSQ